MSNYHVIIKGHKDNIDINVVLENLSILFKSDIEKIRPVLASKNYIAKRSLELDVAKKYKKILEDAGCVAVIESEFDFDEPVTKLEASSGKSTTSINNIVATDGNGEAADHSVSNKPSPQSKRKIMLLASSLITISGLAFGILTFSKGGESQSPMSSESTPEQNVSQDQAASPAISQSDSQTDTPATQSATNPNEKLGEIVSKEHSDFLGDYYVVNLKLAGFSPTKVNIKAKTPEEALAKVVKKDDFLLVRRENNLEEVYVARYGKILAVYSSFTVPENSPIGVSYQDGRLGSEEESINFEGYSGLNGQAVTITAKRFFQLRDNSLIADADYIWNFSSNRVLHDKGLRTFEAAIAEMGSAKKEFSPDDPVQWNQIMIPATQALLVAMMSGKEAEIKSIYAKLAEKFGNDPVDFLKIKLESLPNNTREAYGLAEAQQEQKQRLLKEQEQKSVNSATNSQAVESNQASIIGLWDCAGEDKKFTFDQNANVTMDAINSGQHMYLHGSYAQNNANIKMSYNSIGNNSRSVPLPNPQYDKAQILSPDKLAVITSDAKTGEDYPPYYCNKTTASTSSARSPAPTINQEGDAMERYANSLASQLENSSLPACQMLASNIRQFGSSGAPDNVKKLQVDAIFDKAPGICF
jgi:hypothetical protein